MQTWKEIQRVDGVYKPITMNNPNIRLVFKGGKAVSYELHNKRTCEVDEMMAKGQLFVKTNEIIKTLSLEELKEAQSNGSDRLIVSGQIDLVNQKLTLTKSNGTFFTIALSEFEPSGTTAPDFNNFDVTDYGHTLKFGEYEAATSALYNLREWIEAQ